MAIFELDRLSHDKIPQYMSPLLPAISITFCYTSDTFSLQSSCQMTSPRHILCICVISPNVGIQKHMPNELFYMNFFFLIFIVIQLQLYAFSPHPSTPPQPNPPPSPTSTLPLDFVHVSFIVAPVNPSLHCFLPTPLWLSLDCS